ncbi:acyl carrier protein [Cytophagaceae bacterium DM2B3-1]|uniref:Acyl carrier protein n=1 Tax=Xanthocytophaga flava TaxID=3048013 RepID=A0AAE3QM23_9BACT|nr:acyl carrier protein [Xanthocytophaga flavus]MDJ1470018.1 acyl carrier protein [Xanthocytophaga flavus]MDJ1481440.1 acyl carrier protein [Xanthocytophaga flavus]MDJ1491418.1 acyl carrier protein [Xanthocytophaga flavus]
MVNVQEKVTEMLVEKLNIEPSQVTPTANFIKDLGIDSLDYIELIMEFEQAFDIRIPDTEGEQLKTVGQAVDYIEKKLNEPKSVA